MAANKVANEMFLSKKIKFCDIKNLIKKTLDVTNFLHWAAEPEMEKRKSVGFKVICFLLILLGLSWVTKKRVWSDLCKKEK